MQTISLIWRMSSWADWWIFWKILAFISFQIIYWVTLYVILLNWCVVFFLLHWLWIYCITSCQLLASLFMLLHCIAPFQTILENSQVKKRWEWVSFYFLHKVHNWAHCTTNLLNLSQVGNLPCIACQVTNKHFGGAGLLHVIFLQ